MKPKYIYTCSYCRYTGYSNSNRCDKCARPVYAALIKDTK